MQFEKRDDWFPRTRHHINVDGADPRWAQNVFCVCPERSHSVKPLPQHARFAAAPPPSTFVLPGIVRLRRQNDER